MEVPVGVEPTVIELQSIALASWLRNQWKNYIKQLLHKQDIQQNFSKKKRLEEIKSSKAL